MSEDYKLPMDIQIEIMKRLPVKSLMKFRSVSKQWKSIIRSSRFITDYNNSHIQPHHLSFVVDDYVHHVDVFDDDGIRFIQRITLNMSAEHPDLGFYKLIGHSQGLFGFRCYNKKTSKDAVVIWNPSIRKYVVIPFRQQRSYRTNFVFTNFVFTVCNATDPMFLRTSYMVGWHVEILKLSTGVWRTLSNAPRKSLEFSGSTAIDRFIYWIASDRTPEGVILNDLILSFDITNEQFTELCLPDILAQHSHTSINKLQLSKLRESLVVLQRTVHTKQNCVWMMEPGVENSFKKLYTIKPPHTKFCPIVLGFRKNGQPIIFLEAYSHKNVLLFYESDLVSFNQIEISGIGCPTSAGSYMETLLLLDY